MTLEEETAQAFADTLISCLLNGATTKQAARCCVEAFCRNGKLISLKSGSDGRLPQSEWWLLRDRVLARDGYVCTYCGSDSDDLCADHIMPLSRGGSNDESNLACACRPCNSSKRDKTLDEWRGRSL